jgi:hypothetical protein
MNDMFEGVGALILDNSSSSSLLSRSCLGFTSSDYAEVVLFDEHIPFNQILTNFIQQFEHLLRKCLSSKADLLSNSRIYELRALLAKASVDQIIYTYHSTLSMRFSQIMSSISDLIPNQIFILTLVYILLMFLTFLYYDPLLVCNI